MERSIHISADKETTARTFADFLWNLAKDREKLTVALSGGSTPKILFDILAKEYDDKFDWEKIHFYWGDERCVPPYDDESNFKMTREHLFDKIKIPTENIHRILGENNPDDEAPRYSDEIRSNLDSQSGLPAFDLIILGMGDDGHTASIFPHQMRLLTKEKICAVARHPESGQNRITLTGPVINNAKSVAFLVTGSGKREKVTEIFSKSKSAEAYPAYHIKPTSGELHWFLDKDAAPE